MDIANSTPTQITIHPNTGADSGQDWRDKPLARRFMADRYSGKEIAGTDAEKAYFGENGPEVSDIIDVLNPLQHIPFVSNLYREMTGDTISPAAKIVGGAVLGGPIGLIAAVFDTIFEGETGKGVAGSVVAAITGDTATKTTQVASAARTPGVSEAEYLAIQPATSLPQQTADISADIPLTDITIDQAKQKIAANVYGQRAQDMQFASAEILPPDRKTSAAVMNSTQASDVLGLYGGSVTPAQAAYKNANMLGYLKSASTNVVM